MNSIIIKAPAKVNLFLKVLNKRPDEYHTIETLFEKIALFDKITLSKNSGGISVYSKEKTLPKGRENIAYKAAALIKDKCRIPLGVNIEIEKSIPIGTGLGGGSSDAAAVLLGLNSLFRIGLSEGELKVFARELGADVAFFISNGVWAIGRDRGDSIEPIDTKMELWHLLVIPPSSISSKDAYEWADRKVHFGNIRPDIKDALYALRHNDVKLLGKRLYNDLEGITFERFSHVRELKDMLIENGIDGALVSGSGPSLFGISEKEEEVTNLKKKIESAVGHKSWRILKAQTLKQRSIN